MHEADEVIVRDGDTLTNGTHSNGANGTNGAAGTPVEERVVNHVRTLEVWYAAELERRLAALTEVFKTHLQIQVEELQQHYERRVQTMQASAQTVQASAQTVQASPQIAQVSAPASAAAHHPANLREEIQRTEALAHKCASELERMVADDSVNLGLLLQMRNQQLEVRSYLRGLKYAAESGQTSPSARAERENL